MWRTVDAVLRKRSVLGVYARAGSGSDISKNGSRPRTKNRKCHDISPRTLRRAISTRRGHFTGRLRRASLLWYTVDSVRAVVLAFTANKQANKRTLSIIYIDYYAKSAKRNMKNRYKCYNTVINQSDYGFGAQYIAGCRFLALDLFFLGAMMPSSTT